MRASSLLMLCAVTVAATSLSAQSSRRSSGSVDARLLPGLTWRNVGPFRAGRVSAVSGAIGQPGVFYFGAANGGVWKTTSAGETWLPVFDSITSMSSIGAIEVAPSDPNVIYVGGGDFDSFVDGLGDGVYKSSDAGRTWRHMGLEDAKQIPSILVDPRTPNTVLVAALGDVRVPAAGRGVFRSTDGGTSWTKTLTVDAQNGAVALTRAFDTPDVIFAATIYDYFPPGSGSPPVPDTARLRTRLYKSADAGVTWREISGNGLPALNGIVSIAVGTGAQRVYVIGDFGLYRSDDGGATWRQMAADDKRIANGQGGYNSGVLVDPKNSEIVYTFHVTAYKSTDGGNSFTAFKGGPPGGDDPQVGWIDPTDGKRMLLGYDQGAIVSFDGGDSWSSWYNQSTEQVYHVAADNSFPYWIYATQQDAGAIATRSRGNLGAVTSIDWKPVPGWEWGTILPDPRDPNVVYSSGLSIAKITFPSGEWINVGPELDPSLKLAATLNLPIAFGTWRGRQELLAGYQVLLASADGGVSWTTVSPDLTIPHPNAPLLTAGRPPVRDTTLPQRGIWSIAVSARSPGLIWTGTTNGIVQLTRDHGKSWTDVTIPGTEIALRPIRTAVEASPLDPGVAYVSLDKHFRADDAPYVYRTRDYGKTWTKVVEGLQGVVHVVRADPQQRGLLFAGTATAVFVSFDDGDHWQSLMLNLPTTIINDIAIHDNDLIVGTYGRGIWILDDYAVLRQIRGALATKLFRPSAAVRMRRNVNYNTPFPKEQPQAPNPPAGVAISYALATTPASEIALDILDARGALVRHLTSAPALPVREAARAPMERFWLASPTALTATVGLNRAVWDLRYDPPPAFAHAFVFNGNPGSTPAEPEGALALPGAYRVRLTVDGRQYTQPLTVARDPRSRAAPATLVAQHAFLMRLTSGLTATWADFKPVAELRDRVRQIAPSDTTSELGKAAKLLAATLDSIAGDSLEDVRLVWDPRPAAWNFVNLNREFALELGAQDNADQTPTRASLAVARASCGDLGKLVGRWRQFVQQDLMRFNQLLVRQATTPLSASPTKARLCAT